MSENLIEIKNLEKTYTSESSFLSPKKEPQHVLKNINLNIKKGEIVSLVGESGCGKSTLANCILKLIVPEKGEILFNNENILKFNKKETFNYRKKIQMIFQNPYSSLNPKMKILDTLIEPLTIHKEKNKWFENPIPEELKANKHILEYFTKELYPSTTIIALGKTAKTALETLEVKNFYSIRHPSNDYNKEFPKQISEFL